MWRACIVKSPHYQAVAKHLGKLCKALSTLSAAAGLPTKVCQITGVLLKNLVDNGLV
ncbi:hypothetical protein K457DRAFT_133392 [Linnemannia elongata AG-77]|uniref:Uncharacterized protein n=1 Tax=Linnemannia elongata AG-77 TaxID=1314771 RepID=A0A197KB83_9FUNG|nr:hypothetical protein K457DRAFT_133392 [Linnemannia elongata AG-77]